MTKVAASKHPELIAMYVAGATQDEVGQIFGVTGSGVHRILKRYGIGKNDCAASGGRMPRGYRYQADFTRRDAMADMYRNGSTLTEVGAAFGISSERVRQIIAKAGVSRIDGGKCMEIFLRTHDKVSELRAQDARRECRASEMWGMSAADLKAHKAEYGSSGKQGSPMQRYIQQRSNARKRGLAWNFTFAQWWGVWLASGKWDLRGKGDAYVMARWGDGDAPYSVETVYICTHSQNSKDSFLVSPAAERAIKAARTKAERGVADGRPGLGYTIVKRNKTNPYQAQIKGRYLGSFPTAEQARAAYLAASTDN